MLRACEELLQTVCADSCTHWVGLGLAKEILLLGSALRTAARGARVAESLQLESQPEKPFKC